MFSNFKKKFIIKSQEYKEIRHELCAQILENDNLKEVLEQQKKFIINLVDTNRLLIECNKNYRKILEQYGQIKDYPEASILEKNLTLVKIPSQKKKTKNKLHKSTGVAA